jgi:hypothetical protein
MIRKNSKLELTKKLISLLYFAFYRDKIKTVSFLLPMDMTSYSKNSSSLKYLPNQTTNKLSIIAEKEV